MNQREHWEHVYSTRPAEKLGWYEPHIRTSLAWIASLGLAEDAPVIDVGGGTSALAEDLVAAGHRAITVLDISGKALSSARARLGDKAGLVTWVEGDITSVRLPACHYDLWHDRAVFHFLTAPESQRQYRQQAVQAIKPGGHLIIGAFAEEAPPACSGLPVQRYGHAQLAAALGGDFELLRHHKKLHVTPGGIEQMYIYCLFRKAVTGRAEKTRDAPTE